MYDMNRKVMVFGAVKRHARVRATVNPLRHRDLQVAPRALLRCSRILRLLRVSSVHGEVTP